MAVRWTKSYVFALGAALALCGASRPAAAGQMHLAQPDAAGFPRIHLYLYPTGATGEPITGASAGAFEVREGDRVVSVEEFRDSTQGTPIDVCLTIDRSGSMFEEAKLQSAQRAATLFLRSMRPADRAALVSFADRPTLNRSLTHDAAGVAQSAQTLAAYGGTALYDALYASVNQVALAPKTQGSVLTTPARSEARRVVLALTDGIDNLSRTTARQVIDLARANGVTIYTIGLGSDAQPTPLLALAQATGGRYFAAPGPDALAQLYALIARQLHSEYALTYRTPNPTADGSRREVSVTFRSPTVPLVASGWYQAPGAGSSLITFGPPGTAGRSGSPLSAEASPAPGRALQPLLGLVVVALAGGGAIVAYLLWRGRAPASGPPTASSAQILHGATRQLEGAMPGGHASGSVTAQPPPAQPFAPETLTAAQLQQAEVREAPVAGSGPPADPAALDASAPAGAAPPAPYPVATPDEQSAESSGEEPEGVTVNPDPDSAAAPDLPDEIDRTLLHPNPRLDLRPLWVRSSVTDVGRAEGNDLVLDSPLVSRRHARIEIEDGEYRLVDVGSANGTYLNGKRIHEALLAVGDIIRFADQEFRFAGEQTI